MVFLNVFVYIKLYYIKSISLILEAHKYINQGLHKKRNRLRVKKSLPGKNLMKELLTDGNRDKIT
jgi:hypothetical protein